MSALALENLRAILRERPPTPNATQTYAHARLTAALAIVGRESSDEESLTFIGRVADGRELADLADRVRAAVWLLEREGGAS